jgi:hypothetical protein
MRAFEVENCTCAAGAGSDVKRISLQCTTSPKRPSSSRRPPMPKLHTRAVQTSQTCLPVKESHAHEGERLSPGRDTRNEERLLSGCHCVRARASLWPVLPHVQVAQL